MGRRGRIRPETLLVLILSLLSAGIVSASVAIALDGLTRRSTPGPVAVLPDVLFSREPARPAKIAPVTDAISSELEPEPSPSTSPVPSPSPSPSPKPSPTKPPSPLPSPSPSPQLRTAFSLEMTATLRGSGNNRRITYDTIVTNTGETTLSSVHFFSHVPSKTQWQDASCGGQGLPVYVTYDNQPVELVCIPGSPPVAGSDDPSVHPVDVTLGRSLGPGGTVTISYEVSVVRDASGDVTNHSHVESGGLRVDSPAIVIKVD